MPHSQAKDFETAFGNLSSSYGLYGIPSPTVTFTQQELSKPSFSASSKSTFVSRSSLSTCNVSQSTLHIVPLGRHKSFSSDATIVQPTVVRKTKRDYEAAFGALSSTYGIGVLVPALPDKHIKSAHTWSKLGGLFWTRKTSTKPMQDAELILAQTSVCPKSNYQAACGDLSSAYGTSGNIPSLPSKRMKSSHVEVEARKSLWPAKASSKISQDEKIPAGKDYNAAFGSLASSYGLYGCPHAPSMASKDPEF